MSTGPYLLDTGVLLELVVGKTVGKYIEETYKLRDVGNRPLLSVISHGEIQGLCESQRWDAPRREALEAAVENVVTVDVNHEDVFAAYAAMYVASKNHPKGDRSTGIENDLWIGACAKVYGATLLTMDTDFDHLHPQHLTRIYIDQKAVKAAAKAAGL